MNKEFVSVWGYLGALGNVCYGGSYWKTLHCSSYGGNGHLACCHVARLSFFSIVVLIGGYFL